MTKWIWLAGAAVGALASPAFAQGGASPAGPTVSVLEEVVVTARRREESSQRVPVAVNAFTAEALKQKSIDNLDQLTFSTPGLTYGRAGGASNPQIVIRSQSRANIGDAAQPVLTYFADVPLPAYGSVLPTFDMSSVQVLKGPQGTLFGRNSTSGAVLTYPVMPGYALGGYVTAGVGNLNRREIEGAITVPIAADKAALRLAAQRIKRDPYTKNVSGFRDFDDVDDTSFRVSLLLDLNENLRNVTVYDRTEWNRASDGAVLNHVYPGTIPQRLPGLNVFYDCNTAVRCDIDLALAEQKARGVRATTSSLDGKLDVLVTGLANTTTWDVGPVTFKNIYGFRTTRSDTINDNDGSFLTMVTAIQDIQFRQMSDEFQIQADLFDGRLEAIAGAFYLKSEPNGPSGLTLASFSPPSGASVIQSYREQTSKALFAHGSLNLGSLAEGLKLNAGARRTWDETTACAVGYVALSNPVRPGTPLASQGDCEKGGSVVVNGVTIPVRGSIVSGDSSAWTWNLGLDYQATENLFFYATARRGYRAGGVNTPLFSTTAPRSLSALQVYGPETVTDFEVGMKSQWNIGGWTGRLNVDVFRGDYEDTQRGVNGLANFDLDGNTSNDPSAGTIIINAGEARVQGIDIDLMVSPIAPLQLTAFFSYNDAKYKSLGTPALLAATTAFPSTPGATAFPYAPETTGGLGVRYEAALSETLGALVFNLDYYRASRTYFSSFKTDVALSQAPYSLINGRIDWKGVGGRDLTLSLYGKNLTDEEFVTGGAQTAQTAGHNSFYYGEPRTYGVQLNYAF